MATSKLSLKLLIDKNGKRVLFAEAGKEFVDFLFSLITLPIGTVLSLLNNKDMAGSLPMLYQSISDLDVEYLKSDQKKDVILRPTASLPFLAPQDPLLPIEESKPSVTPADQGPSSLSSKHLVDTKGGFVKGLVTYMVADDLGVSPMSTTSTISNMFLLDKFNIKDFGALEEKIVQIGTDEGLELLRHSLNSKTVLTNVFLKRKDHSDPSDSDSDSSDSDSDSSDSGSDSTRKKTDSSDSSSDSADSESDSDSSDSDSDSTRKKTDSNSKSDSTNKRTVNGTPCGRAKKLHLS